MKVFVTGATGFIGSYVLEQLQASGYTVRCLVRGHAPEGVESVRGDVTEPATLGGTMDGCGAVIHLVGIIKEKRAQGITFELLHTEATGNVVQEARRAGVERFVHMSANGAAPDGVSRYQVTKWQAEELVRAAGFTHWTVLCPGLVFGRPAPGTTEFCTHLACILSLPLPVVPLFGKGDFRLQPVSASEVAAALVQAITRDAVHSRRITAVGRESLTYRDAIDRITQALGRRPRAKMTLPPALVRAAIKRFDRLGIVPITLDQFDMLIRGNTGDPSLFYQSFDLTPQPFTLQNLCYLRRRVQDRCCK